jgi:hypothetical protein
LKRFASTLEAPISSITTKSRTKRVSPFLTIVSELQGVHPKVLMEPKKV